MPAAWSAVLIANVVDTTLLVIVLLENTIPPEASSYATGLPLSSSGIFKSTALSTKLSLFMSRVSQRS